MSIERTCLSASHRRHKHKHKHTHTYCNQYCNFSVTYCIRILSEASRGRWYFKRQFYQKWPFEESTHRKCTKAYPERSIHFRSHCARRRFFRIESTWGIFRKFCLWIEQRLGPHRNHWKTAGHGIGIVYFRFEFFTTWKIFLGISATAWSTITAASPAEFSGLWLVCADLLKISPGRARDVSLYAFQLFKSRGGCR